MLLCGELLQRQQNSIAEYRTVLMTTYETHIVPYVVKICIIVHFVNAERQNVSRTLVLNVVLNANIFSRIQARRLFDTEWWLKSGI